jgi:hypothetical protein
LSAAGFASAIASKQPKTSKAGRLARTISAILSGALLGFFYAGTATNNNSQAAIAGMAIGGVLMFFVSSRIRGQFAQVAIASAGSVATYAAAFLFSATASAFLSTHKLFWGMGLRWCLSRLLFERLEMLRVLRSEGQISLMLSSI